LAAGVGTAKGAISVKPRVTPVLEQGPVLWGKTSGTEVAPAPGAPPSGASSVPQPAPAPTPLDWSIVSKSGETRPAHVEAQHGALILRKRVQGVFYGDPVDVINDAWAIAQRELIAPITDAGVDIYVVPRPNSGFAGGYSGQRQNLDTVTIITQQGTAKIVTGFPGNGAPFPRP
jgi:hypothetical protein